MHRVRSVSGSRGRFSVPFFFEPGVRCLVKGVDDEGDEGEGVRYGEHVLGKMGAWVEFAGAVGGDAGAGEASGMGDLKRERGVEVGVVG